MVKVSVNLEPVPKARPRVNIKTKGRYISERSRKFQQDLKLLLRASYTGAMLQGELSVTLRLWRPLKPTSRRYGDTDNLAKAILDAANGILWQDDSQITKLTCCKLKGSGRIEIEVDS